MTVWEALEFLNTLVDDSDPDVDFTQIEHALQTAEAIRAAGQPRWFIVTGLVHDLGKILCLFGEPQWAVVGDTFPVGCRWSPKIVYSQFFSDNPGPARARVPDRERHLRAGLRPRQRAHVVGPRRVRLPRRQGSTARTKRSTCCATTRSTRGTRKSEYSHLLNDRDRAMVKWVRAFNRYDLYSKGSARPKVEELMPFYEDLVKEFFPAPLRW